MMKWLGQLFSRKAQSPVTAAARVNTRVYRPDGWNIEFDIPEDWEILFEDRPEPPNYGVFGIIGQKSGGPGPSVLLLTQVVENTGEGLDAYMASAARQLSGMFREFRVIKKAHSTYQGVPTAVMEYEYQGSSGPIQELNMTAFFGERVTLAFQFICEADKREVTTDRAIQRQVIDSIRIGSKGIRVPYLNPYGQLASSCRSCGSSLKVANALFNGRSPIACYCDKCWKD